MGPPRAAQLAGDSGLNFPEETLYLQWEAQPTTGDTTFPRGNSAVSPVESPVGPS